MKVYQKLLAVGVGVFTFGVSAFPSMANEPPKTKTAVVVTPEQKAAFEVKKAAAIAKKKATLQARKAGSVIIQTATGGCVGGKVVGRPDR